MRDGNFACQIYPAAQSAIGEQQCSGSLGFIVCVQCLEFMPTSVAVSSATVAIEVT